METDPLIPLDELPSRAQRAARVVIQANLAGMIGPLRALRLRAPAYALALWPSGDPDDLVSQVISVGLEPDRARLVAERPASAALHDVWNAADFAVEVQYECDPRSQPAYAESALIVVSALYERGLVDPARWAMNVLAAELTGLELIAPRTADFVAYAFDYTFGPDLPANLEFTASAATLAALNEAGLLPSRGR